MLALSMIALCLLTLCLLVICSVITEQLLETASTTACDIPAGAWSVKSILCSVFQF
jgi:uncharacterized membrane protein YqjE